MPPSRPQPTAAPPTVTDAAVARWRCVPARRRLPMRPWHQSNQADRPFHAHAASVRPLICQPVGPFFFLFFLSALSSFFVFFPACFVLRLFPPPYVRVVILIKPYVLLLREGCWRHTPPPPPANRGPRDAVSRCGGVTSPRQGHVHTVLYGPLFLLLFFSFLFLLLCPCNGNNPNPHVRSRIHDLMWPDVQRAQPKTIYYI